MCGIAGYTTFDKSEIEEEILSNITEVLYHRGPDYGSTKIIDNVGLGHRRLSIIDLSDAANQPMSNGNITLVFNGEIYNFQEIRSELQSQGTVFSTQSDTEVILKAFEQRGVKCFEDFNGMFAIAIYDSIKKELILARDHYGLKPLYYYCNEEFLVFGSEMKAILRHPKVKVDVNLQGLSEFIWFGNTLGANSIYEQINEVDPGCYLKIKSQKFTNHRYFDVTDIEESSDSEENAIKKIRTLFEDSVKRQLISDVPVGVFLSGGIDSSAITAIASKHYKGKLNTYSVGFDFEKGPNELELAAEIAKEFNTNHHEIHISGENLIDTIEALVVAHDCPFGDAADIPLYLLTKKLKGDIKVVLQGDGGDEFFGGYSRYKTLQNISRWKMLSFLPKLIQLSGIQSPKILRLQRFINAISQTDPAVRNALLLTMESKYTDPLRIFNEDYKKLLRNTDPFKKYKEIYKILPKNIDRVQAMFITDTQIILKDTFFEKVDKATMSNSMEVRLPFLDQKLTEFMISLPATLKVKDGVNKYLFKKAMEGIVPYKILYGKKTGFSVPYSYWLKTTLAEYFTLQISTVKAAEYLDVNEINRMFELHKNDKGNYGFLLWKTLMLAIWINKK